MPSKALLIDIRYATDSDMHRTSETLSVSTARMSELTQCLQTQFEMSPTNIRVLTDYEYTGQYAAATRANIMATLPWLCAASANGDQHLLFVLGATARDYSTNYILPMDWADAGVVTADMVILCCVLPLHANATLTVWLDCNHPQTPINQLQYMFESRAQGSATVSGVRPDGSVRVIPGEFSNDWFLKDDKGLPLPRRIVMYASVLPGATPQTARGLVGKMTTALLHILTELSFAVRNRTLVKALHVACAKLLNLEFRAVMSTSQRSLFNAWFLRNAARPGLPIRFV
jgi:hypothetical protein